MPNYSSSLQSWGDSGTQPDATYDYVEGEQPVDGFDNWFNFTVIDEIETLIDFINNDILGADGVATVTADLQDDNSATLWDYSEGTIPGARVGVHGSTHHYGNSDEIDAGDLSGGSGSSTDGLRTDGTTASWQGFDSYNGNDIDTDGDGVVNQADDTNQYSGTSPGDGSPQQVLTTTGSSTQWEDQPTKLFGDGNGGDVVISSNQTMSGMNVVNSLTVDSGVTLSSGSYLVVIARDHITINGTIDGSGNDGGGGSGGSGGGTEGGRGGNGGGGGNIVVLASPDITVSGTIDVSGGNGQNGQNGGDSGQSSQDSGGGDGGNGSGMFYGGGDAVNRTGHSFGGKASDMGGLEGEGGDSITTDPLTSDEMNLLHVSYRTFPYDDVIFEPPNTVGSDGGGGGGGRQDDGNGGGGGGGGGGSGGLIALFTGELTNNGTLDVSGGGGGGGGTDWSGLNSGYSGASGESGESIIVEA